MFLVPFGKDLLHMVYMVYFFQMLILKKMNEHY